MEIEILNKDAKWGMRASKTSSEYSFEYPPRLVVVNEPINPERFGFAILCFDQKQEEILSRLLSCRRWVKFIRHDRTNSLQANISLRQSTREGEHWAFQEPQHQQSDET